MSGVVWKPGENEIPDGKFGVFYDLDLLQENDHTKFLNGLLFCSKVIEINQVISENKGLSFDLKTDKHMY